MNKPTPGDWQQIGDHVVSVRENPNIEGRDYVSPLCKIVTDRKEHKFNARLFINSKDLLNSVSSLLERVAGIPAGSRPEGLNSAVLETKKVLKAIKDPDQTTPEI